MRRVVLLILALVPLTVHANDATSVEREIATHARTVARELERHEPWFASWEFAAIDANPNRDPRLTEAVEFTLRYLEIEITNRGLTYVDPDRRSALISEIDFSRSEDARWNEAIRAGRLLAVDAIAFVDIATLSGNVVIVTSAVEVASGRTLFTESISLDTMPTLGSLVLEPRDSGWAVSVSMGAVLPGQHQMPGTNLPTPVEAIRSGLWSETDSEIPDTAVLWGGAFSYSIGIRRYVSDTFAAQAVLSAGNTVHRPEITIDGIRRYHLVRYFNAPSRIDVSARFSTGRDALIDLALEPGVAVSALFGAEQDGGMIPGQLIVLSAVAAGSIELEISEHLAARFAPSVAADWFVVASQVPEIVGRVSVAFGINGGIMYRW